MQSPRIGVVCSLEVDYFRQNLFSAEAELFNECLMHLYRDPREDKIHKFPCRVRPPLVESLYRDENFVLIYYWEQFSDLTAHRVTVFKAYRTCDLNEEFDLKRY